MMKIRVWSSLLAFMLVFVACTDNGKNSGKTVDNRLRQKTIFQVESMNANLPYKFPSTSLSIDRAKVDGDIIEYTASVPDSLFEAFILSEDEVNSDKYIAKFLKDINHQVLNEIIEAGFGLRFIYKSSESGKTLLRVEVDCDRLSRIKEGLDSGELVPFTVLELLQREIDISDFPYELDENLWMIDGYIKGNTVYYIYKLEGDITSDDLSYSDIMEMKQGILEDLEQVLLKFHKKEMTQKGIRLVYIYKNKYDKEFARIEITADDF